MSSAICFNLDQSKILSSDNGLNSLLQEHGLTLPNSEFADKNFIFGENGRKVSQWLENTTGKGEIAHLLITSNFPFFHCVFKRLLLQTCNNQGLFGKELKLMKIAEFSKRVENTVGKGEIACFEQCRLCPQCFQNIFIVET